MPTTDRLDLIRSVHAGLAASGRLRALGLPGEQTDDLALVALERRLCRLCGLSGALSVTPDARLKGARDDSPIRPAPEFLQTAPRPRPDHLAAGSEPESPRLPAAPTPCAVASSRAAPQPTRPALDMARLSAQVEALRAIEDEAAAVEAVLIESAALAGAVALLDEREAELAEIQAESARVIEAAAAVRTEQLAKPRRPRQSSTPRPRAREPRTKPTAPGRKAPKRIYKTPRHHRDLTLEVVAEALTAIGYSARLIGMKRLAHGLRARGCQLYEPVELALELRRLGLPPILTDGYPYVDTTSPAVRRIMGR